MKRFGVILLGFWILLFLPFSISHSKNVKENDSVSKEKGAYNTLKKDSSQVIDKSFRGKAVSLRVLQKRLEAHKPERDYPKELLQLDGITRIVGYVVDDVQHDVILIGEVDSEAPPLHLEDFVIALRNAWLSYAKLKGNTYYYSNPSCSIDPDPKVIQKLDKIVQQLFGSSSSGRIEKVIDNWQLTCQLPQKVKVMGIPFHTHFAWVMVKADYDMKSLADGSDILNIPDFASLTDMTLEMAKADILQDRPLSIPQNSMNRFWFHPGENRYLEDKGIVIIKDCKVILLTEEEFLSKSGNIEGSGRSDPFAQKFAGNFSTMYGEIAGQRPIYTELENLFRFVALAKIMKYSTPHEEAGLNLEYLLERYTIAKTPVNQKLPGRSNVKSFEHRREIQGGYQIAQLHFPSCGGVGIDIQISQSHFVKDSTGILSELRAEVLRARPSPDAFSWPLPSKKDVKLDNENTTLERFVFTRQGDKGLPHL